jgi:hypothetical protein
MARGWHARLGFAPEACVSGRPKERNQFTGGPPGSGAAAEQRLEVDGGAGSGLARRDATVGREQLDEGAA